jgi:large subunit ribosomal protein L10
MKTKAQKQEMVDEAKDLIAGNGGAVFADIQGITVAQLMQLRRQVRTAGGRMVVCKKRLLGVAMKDSGMSFDTKDYNGAIGAVFTPEGVETASGPVVKFFKELKLEKEKVLGGYDFATKAPIEKEQVLFIGTLPSREVVLSQLMGMLQAPMRSFLYILQQKSQQS